MDLSEGLLVVADAINDNSDRGRDVVEYFMVDMPEVESLDKTALMDMVEKLMVSNLLCSHSVCERWV